MKKTLQHLGSALLVAGTLGLTQTQAQTIYGLTTTDQLVSFSVGNTAAVSTGVAVTGVTAGFTIVGMDFRPATGELFAIAWNGTSGQSQLYKIALGTGVATPVGAALTTLNLSGRVGFDFNPTVDRIRVTTTGDFNYRLNPNNGALAFVDGPLAFNAGDVNFGDDPSISASAYTNSVIAASSTTLYNYDDAQNILVSQVPPNDGKLNTIGSTGIVVDPTNPMVDMDISYSATTGLNTAYLTANVGGRTRLYTLNTANGTATSRGNLPVGLMFRGMSVFIDRTAPAATGQIAYGLSGGNLISFDTGTPQFIRTAVGITGLSAAPNPVEALLSIDFRPATGELFGLAYTASTQAARLVTINTTTGALTTVGTGLTGLDLTGKVEIDFNPTVDRIRVVTSNNKNYRLNPITGAAVTPPDLDLNYAAGDPNFGTDPAVSAAAYTNNFQATSTTTLYDYDLALNTLSTQVPPNNGVLNTIGTSGLAVNPTTGEASLDIYTNPNTQSNTAYLAASPTGGMTRLYTVNLANGQVSNIGMIGMGLLVRDIALQQGAVASACVTGTFTVNKNAPATATNFTSMSAAVSALNTNGICGPVTLNVIAGSGPYLEQVQLNALSGSSATNTITINGNGNVLRGTPNRKALHVLKINGTDFLTVNNLTIESAAGAPYGWGIHLRNNAQNVSIMNSTITVNSTSTAKRDFMGIVATASDGQYNYKGNNVTNLTLMNNTVTGGYEGIRINGDTLAPSTGIMIMGNTVNAAYETGIHTNNLAAPMLNQNMVMMRSGNMMSHGMHLEDLTSSVSVQRNRVTNAGMIGLYMLRVNTAGTGSVLIANNMMGGGFQNTAMASGIELNDVDNAQVVFNSVNVDNGSMGMALDVTKPYSTGLDIRNNSLAYTGSGAGYAVFIGEASSVSMLDYNNYFTTGSKFAFFNRMEFADLAALMMDTMSTVMHDMNSVSGNPNYLSATDLHASGTVLSNQGIAITGVTVDFDGATRSSTPDIGADEFSPARLAGTAAAGTITGTSVYPNPVSGNELNLETYATANGTLQLTITDLLGRVVLQQSALVTEGANRQVLSLPASMGSGLYVITLQQNGEQSQLKFRKN